VSLIDAFYEWTRLEGPERHRNRDSYQRYFRGIADARYAVRGVLRIIDDQAKQAGLEPLQHHALIQIFAGGDLQVNEVASRLGIAPAFASRLVRELESKDLIARAPSLDDRRVTFVTITEQGIETLRQIDLDVHAHVAYFQSQLSERERAAAVGMIAFYVGLSLDVKAVGDLRGELMSALFPEERESPARSPTKRARRRKSGGDATPTGDRR
jgi:DNA-binding MarR family transcriptional regulator